MFHFTVRPFASAPFSIPTVAAGQWLSARRATEAVDRLRGKAEMHFKLVVKEGTLEEAVAELPAGVGGEYLRKLRQSCWVEGRQNARSLHAGA